MRVELTFEGADWSIYVRELGRGHPLLHLHGGWGHGIYPFDSQAAELSDRYRVLIPDRSGYGRSTRRSEPFELDFHRRAARETLALMDGMDIERAIVWGHSDGAVTAAWMALEAPDRCDALILEALHFDREKAGSEEFFETMATAPADLGRSVAAVMAQEHGADYWERLARREGAVWRAIQQTPHPWPDLFDGRLGRLRGPVLILHGAQDPRTEPGEIEAVREALPSAEVRLLEGGGHSPHSEAGVRRLAGRAALSFLRRQGL